MERERTLVKYPAYIFNCISRGISCSMTGDGGWRKVFIECREKMDIESTDGGRG